MDLPVFYEVNLNWKEGRKGEIGSPAFDKLISVVTPPEFPKGIDGEWTPEHLFLGAVVGCYMTTFLAIAENSKLPFQFLNCRSNGKLEMVEGKLMISEILIEPEIGIVDEKLRAKAELILQKTESNCLISNSTKSKITIKTKIHISERN